MKGSQQRACCLQHCWNVLLLLATVEEALLTSCLPPALTAALLSYCTSDCRVLLVVAHAACWPLLSPRPTGQFSRRALATAAYVKGDNETIAVGWAGCGRWLHKGQGCPLAPAGAAWRGWNTAAPQGLCLMSVQYVPHNNVDILCHPDELVHDAFGRPAIPASHQSVGCESKGTQRMLVC